MPSNGSLSKKGIAPIIRKTVLILFLFISGAALVGLIYWETQKKKIIRRKIERAIAKASNGLYKVKFGDIVLDETRGSLTFINAHISYDSAKYSTLVNQHLAPANLFNLDLPRLKISGLKISRLLLKNEIKAKSLEVIDPVISITYTQQKPDSSSKEPEKELYKRILGSLGFISLDRTLIHNATLMAANFHEEKDKLLFTNINLALGHLQIDSVANADTSRIAFAKTAEFNIENISWFSDSMRYKYLVKKITFSSVIKSLIVGEILIIPQLPEDQFAKSTPFQNDRYDIQFSGIHAENVQAAYLLKTELNADKLTLSGCKMNIYRDLNVPRDQLNRAGTYPQQIIMKFPVHFAIAKASFENLYISYREKSDITQKVGNTIFNKNSIFIDNLTNEPQALETNNICKVKLNTVFLKMVPFQISMVMPLGDPNGKFLVEGSSGNGVDAVKLNDLVIPEGLARIREGHVNSLQFRLNGSNTRADGTVKLLYNGLKIDYLQFGNDGKIKKRHIGSFIANLILKNSNPGKNGETRVAEVHHQRDMNRSFYNLVWKSIFEGINKTIGNNKPMKRP